MSHIAPALFIGHGSPMNAISSNPWTGQWEELARHFPKPEAILCVSAHWLTEGPAVTVAQRPRTIHDFYGFPRALYELDYPAPGAPALAADMIEATGARADAEWGLDHGAWSVLRFLYPKADIPVLQFSLDRRASGAEHYALGLKLARFRTRNVLILGSGNIVHNLRLHRDGEAQGFAARFDKLVREKIERRDHKALIAYEALGSDAALAIPTPEHYWPLLYVLAAQGPEEVCETFAGGVTGALSMTSVAVGLPRSSRVTA
jgi:4,5-DOPA dioxygenase extradiol